MMMFMVKLITFNIILDIANALLTVHISVNVAHDTVSYVKTIIIDFETWRSQFYVNRKDCKLLNLYINSDRPTLHSKTSNIVYSTQEFRVYTDFCSLVFNFTCL